MKTEKFISNNKGIALGVLFSLGLIEMSLAWVFDKYATELFLSGLFVVMIVAINSVGLIAEHFEEKEDIKLKNGANLNLRVIDFEGSSYVSPFNCPIAKALKRQLNLTGVRVGTDNFSISTRDNVNEIWRFSKYGAGQYGVDREIAGKLEGETTIRTIILTKA